MAQQALERDLEVRVSPPSEGCDFNAKCFGGHAAALSVQDAHRAVIESEHIYISVIQLLVHLNMERAILTQLLYIISCVCGLRMWVA